MGSCSGPTSPTPRMTTLLSMAIFLQHRAREVALFELALLVEAFALRPDFRDRIRPVLAARDEIIPRRDAALPELLHEIVERGPRDVVREARIPRDVHAELEMLVETEIASELPLHEGERPLDGGPREPDLVDRMRGLEL